MGFLGNSCLLMTWATKSIITAHAHTVYFGIGHNTRIFGTKCPTGQIFGQAFKQVVISTILVWSTQSRDPFGSVALSLRYRGYWGYWDHWGHWPGSCRDPSPQSSPKRGKAESRPGYVTLLHNETPWELGKCSIAWELGNSNITWELGNSKSNYITCRQSVGFAGWEVKTQRTTSLSRNLPRARGKSRAARRVSLLARAGN